MENSAVDLSQLTDLVSSLSTVVTSVIGISVTVIGFWIGTRIIKRFIG